jgi:hypothetical protein
MSISGKVCDAIELSLQSLGADKSTNKIGPVRFEGVHSKAAKCRVGQNCIHTPYMTICLVISLPKIPYIHRTYMVLANPKSMLQQ